MMATTVMGVVMIIWCLVTIAVQPEKRGMPPLAPDLSKKVDATGKPMLDPFGKQVDPLGFIGRDFAGTFPATGELARLVVEPGWSDRYRAVVRALDPGDERRGDACSGLPRSREPQAQELQGAALSCLYTVSCSRH